MFHPLTWEDKVWRNVHASCTAITNNSGFPLPEVTAVGQYTESAAVEGGMWSIPIPFSSILNIRWSLSMRSFSLSVYFNCYNYLRTHFCLCMFKVSWSEDFKIGQRFMKYLIHFIVRGLSFFRLPNWMA